MSILKFSFLPFISMLLVCSICVIFSAQATAHMIQFWFRGKKQLKYLQHLWKSKWYSPLLQTQYDNFMVLQFIYIHLLLSAPQCFRINILIIYMFMYDCVQYMEENTFLKIAQNNVNNEIKAIWNKGMIVAFRWRLYFSVFDCK